jgi:hypothetical protein
MSIFKKIALSIFILSLFIFLPSKISAAEFLFKNNTVQQAQTIEDDLYVIGSETDINGVVDGDLFILSDNIDVTGTVTGDVYILGMNVNISGNIYGSLITFSSHTNLNGVYGKNVHIFGVTNEYTGQTAGDLTVIGGSHKIDGNIGDDLRVFGYKTIIEGVVKGDLIYFSEESSILQENVSGNIYNSDTLKNIAKEQGVEVERITPVVEKVSYYDIISTKIVMALVEFVGFCIVGFVLIFLSPIKTGQIVKKVSDSPVEFLKSLGLGFAILCLIPLPLTILLFTMVGTPLAVLIICALMFVLTFGTIYTETALGKEILDLFKVKGYRPYKFLIVGRGLTTVISLIPIIGAFYRFVLICTTVGAISRMKYNAYKLATKKK